MVMLMSKLHRGLSYSIGLNRQRAGPLDGSLLPMFWRAARFSHLPEVLGSARWHSVLGTCALLSVFGKASVGSGRKVMKLLVRHAGGFRLRWVMLNHSEVAPLGDRYGRHTSSNLQFTKDPRKAPGFSHGECQDGLPAGSGFPIFRFR